MRRVYMVEVVKLFTGKRLAEDEIVVVACEVATREVEIERRLEIARARCEFARR